MANLFHGLMRNGSAGSLAVVLFLASPASAAVSITQVGADFDTMPFTFSSGDSTFTFTGTRDPFGPAAVSTGGTGAINTIFGSPTTNFTDRGTVSFGPSMQYAAFSSATPIRFSNGNNFIGLQATAAGETFYGFAYTTNSVLNSFGFETTPGQAITASDAIPGVPESSTWLMMIMGFGFIGAMMRKISRSQHATVRYA